MSSDSVFFVPYASPGGIIAAGAIFPALGIITVLLRFYIRGSRKNSMSIDDWLVVPALLFVIGMGTCLITAVKRHTYGYPIPHPTGSPKDFLTETSEKTTTAGQIEFALNLLMILAYGFIKLSILFFYRRLLVVDRGILNTSIWIMISVVGMWMTTFLLIFTFGCGKHFSAFWGSRLDLITYCSKGHDFQQGLYISEFLVNLILLIMPLPTIWSLHMSLKRKLSVTGVLLLAFMAVIASIIRLAVVLQASSASYAKKIDPLETMGTIYYWGMIEAGLALIACSLPSLKPLITDHGILSAMDSFRSAVTLRQSHNRSGTSRIADDLPSSGYARKKHSEAGSGASETSILRKDNVMEIENNSSFLQEVNRTYQPGSVRIRKEIEMRDSMV